MNNKHLTELTEQLKNQLGERLVSVCVYGSAAVESSPDNPTTDTNVLVVVRNLALADLEQAGETCKRWEKHGRSLPIFMSDEEWRNSADVFALEYADIRDRHQIAYGEDLFSDTAVDQNALRLVCELEVYRKLVFLRQRLLIFRGQPTELVKFMQGSVTSFTAFGRAILRLAGRESVPFNATEVFPALASVVEGLDAKPFLRVAESRDEKNAVSKDEALPLFEAYVRQIDCMNRHLNKGAQ